jgi:dipeptidyl aminopeptidase/acylaminoacyl peptidase
VTSFTDVSAFASIPRLTSLRLSPDGSWLAAGVQTAAGEPRQYVTSIWRLDTAGPDRAPVRLTRGAEGEGSPRFLPDGSLAFAARRPAAPAGPSGGPAPADKAALWLLPAAGGEARRIAAPPGGVLAVAAASNAPVLACVAAVLPGAATASDDAALRQARTDAGVRAILHEGGRIRYWDHDLGPDRPTLLTAPVPAGEAADPADLPEPRDLTPDAGRALDDQEFELTPDGSAVVTSWITDEPGGDWHIEVVAVDTAVDTAAGAAPGGRRVLITATGADFEAPRVSPDGALVLALRSEHDTYDRPGDVTLVTAPLAAGSGALGAGPAGSGPVGSGPVGSGPGQPTGPRDLLPGFDRRPAEAVWAPDSRSVYFTADDQGRRPVFRADLDGGEVVRLTPDDGVYEQLCPAPDGRYLYALRSAIDAPAAPVRIAVSGPETAGLAELASPAGTLTVPGRLDEVTATAADGTTIRGWLVLPEEASPEAPAPLLLWVHGGPVSSWNGWSWRWNPWLMAARGYAVLLPDPALSTGYGQHMIQRGHGTWGGAPYTDVMAITDAVVKRPDIDPGRTAMMGGSFGGYMANWIAGHTDRFAAIVSHAGLWALDQMLATTDWPAYWRRTFGDPLTQPERYLAGSPHRHVADIRTPMLIIHGDKDYRVPVGEALRLWADLARLGKSAKFLYFPDENHWILKPGDVPVWYETVFAFLAEHVLGQAWKQPELL